MKLCSRRVSYSITMHTNSLPLLLSLSTLLVIIISDAHASEDPELVAIHNARKCSSTAECGPGYCCTVGYTRYSEPICKKLSTGNSRCRKRNEGEDRLLSWPNGASKLYKNTYVDVCPCEANYSCRQNRCVTTKKYSPKRPNIDTNNVGSRF